MPHNDSYLSKPRAVITQTESDGVQRFRLTTHDHFTAEVYGAERYFTAIGGYVIPIGGKLMINHVDCEN